MGEVFYTPIKARCDDGVVRTVRARAYSGMGGRPALHADTAFSVPAYVKANGKTVMGYITPGGSMAFMQDHGEQLLFHAYLYRKNHAAIVPLQKDKTDGS